MGTHRDAEGRLHNEKGPAIKWRDGWGVYAWHGTVVPKEWIENPDSLTPKICLTHENMEQRRAACEIYGWDNVINALNPTVIDANPNPSIGTLVEVDLPDIGRERFLRVKCGTGRQFALCVTRFNHNTALECNAATYGWKQGQDINQFIPVHRT